MMDDIAASAGASPTTGSSLPRVYVYFDDPDSEGVIRQALSDLGLSESVFKPGGLPAAITDRSERSSPRLMIVDVGKAKDPAAEVGDLIGMCDPTTAVVVVGTANDIRLYRTLRSAGAAEYFFKPLVTALVSQTCDAILNDEREPDDEHKELKARRGRLILVLGARGGVGATTMAVRTAWRLADNPPRAVALVDLDLQFGDAVLQLDATPNHALRQALERADRVDDLFLERGIIHVTKRLDLMASLEPLDEVITFQEEDFLSLLDTLRQRYRYVVIDLPMMRAAALPGLLSMPSFVVLVSDGGLASAREIARLRQRLGANTPEHTIMHVLNKSGGPGSLPLPEFTRGAGQAPDVIVPWSRDIAAATNLGVKLKPQCPILDSAMSPIFARLSGEIVRTPRSWLGKLFN